MNSAEKKRIEVKIIHKTKRTRIFIIRVSFPILFYFCCYTFFHQLLLYYSVACLATNKSLSLGNEPVISPLTWKHKRFCFFQMI